MPDNETGRSTTVSPGLTAVLGLIYAAACGGAMADNAAIDPDRLLLTVGGQAVVLESWERDYLYQALARLRATCTGNHGDTADSEPATPVFRLTANYEQDGVIELVQAIDPGQGDAAPAITRKSGNGAERLHDCDATYSAPVVAVMQSKQAAPATVSQLQAVAAPASDDEPVATRQDSALAIVVDAEYPRERLSAYEQNHLGWTRDDSSVESGYMDAQMSFKFRAWEGGENDRFGAFFAFSTRFSQYIETIESSPVVGKRYNPQAFLRTHIADRQGYLDTGLAHESNGQSISTEEAYLAERQKYADSDGEPDFARNSISRGWDYVFTDWTHCWLRCSENYALDGIGRLTTKVKFQYYLDDGPFQGNPEEYNEWEGGSERHRKEYDGIWLTTDYRINSGCLGFEDFGCSISWEYRTGYDGAFEKSTNRVQLAVDKFWFFPPIGFWAQSGYNSSLVDYYKSVDSFGIVMLFSNPY